jgi:hypothetical protein
MIKSPADEVKKKVETSLTSLKDARALLEAGHPEGWGRVMEVAPKFNRFGLGFEPILRRQILKAPDSSTPVKFASAGIKKEDQVNAVDDEDDVFNIEDWIRPCIPSSELKNWTSVDTIQVTTAKE